MGKVQCYACWECSWWAPQLGWTDMVQLRDEDRWGCLVLRGVNFEELAEELVLTAEYTQYHCVCDFYRPLLSWELHRSAAFSCLPFSPVQDYS